MPGGQEIFNTVAKGRAFKFYKPDGNGVDVEKLIDYLNFERKDVAKAAGVSLGSVRYDNRMPKEIQERFDEIANICELVAEFFTSDLKKVSLWLKTDNPMLGNIAPITLIRLGKYKKLLRFILDSRDGNMP